MTDALKDLNEMIERIRAEAYAAGRAEGFVAGRTAGIDDARKALNALAVTETFELPAPSKPTRPSAAPVRRSRGSNNAAVLEAMETLGVATGIKFLQNWLWEHRNLRIAYSSLQNALAQLDKEGKARQVARGVWELGSSAQIPPGTPLAGEGDFAPAYPRGPVS